MYAKGAVRERERARYWAVFRKEAQVEWSKREKRTLSHVLLYSIVCKLHSVLVDLVL